MTPLSIARLACRDCGVGARGLCTRSLPCGLLIDLSTCPAPEMGPEATVREGKRPHRYVAATSKP